MISIPLSFVVFVLAHSRKRLFCSAGPICEVLPDSNLQHLTSASSASSLDTTSSFESPARSKSDELTPTESESCTKPQGEGSRCREPEETCSSLTPLVHICPLFSTTSTLLFSQLLSFRTHTNCPPGWGARKERGVSFPVSLLRPPDVPTIRQTCQRCLAPSNLSVAPRQPTARESPPAVLLEG